mgnify:FL=1
MRAKGRNTLKSVDMYICSEIAIAVNLELLKKLLQIRAIDVGGHHISKN